MVAGAGVEPRLYSGYEPDQFSGTVPCDIWSTLSGSNGGPSVCKTDALANWAKSGYFLIIYYKVLFGRSSEIRTHTEPILSRTPLPIGICSLAGPERFERPRTVLETVMLPLTSRTYGSPSWTRTNIDGTKTRCPTIRRSGIVAASLGLEPKYYAPEAYVLPLDDKASF